MYAEYPEIGGSRSYVVRAESDGGAQSNNPHCRHGGREDEQEWDAGLHNMTERIRVRWAKIGVGGETGAMVWEGRGRTEQTVQFVMRHSDGMKQEKE